MSMSRAIVALIAGTNVTIVTDAAKTYGALLARIAAVAASNNLAPQSARNGKAKVLPFFIIRDIMDVNYGKEE